MEQLSWLAQVSQGTQWHMCSTLHRLPHEEWNEALEFVSCKNLPSRKLVQVLDNTCSGILFFSCWCQWWVDQKCAVSLVFHQTLLNGRYWWFWVPVITNSTFYLRDLSSCNKQPNESIMLFAFYLLWPVPATCPWIMPWPLYASLLIYKVEVIIDPNS